MKLRTLTLISLSVSCLLLQVHGLLFPASTSLSLTSSVSVPVTELWPERRLIVDWCFNMGYDLPYNVSLFYNVPIWPGLAGNKGKRDIHSPDLFNEHNHFFEKYGLKPTNLGHPKDFSAGELYEGIEDLLHNYGFHETCLLRSVCELALHPFDEAHSNVLTDVITFVLTPSQHEGFLPTEQVYKEAYELAEQQGFLGANCTNLYSGCKWDLLKSLTKVIFQET